MPLNTITVTGTVRDSAGNPANGGLVTFTPSMTVIDPGGAGVIADATLGARIASDGTFASKPLYCTDPFPGLTYRIVARIAEPDEIVMSMSTHLPHSLGSSVDIGQLPV